METQSVGVSCTGCMCAYKKPRCVVAAMKFFAIFGEIQAVLFLTATRYAISHLYATYSRNPNPAACRTALLLTFLVAYAVCLLAVVLLAAILTAKDNYKQLTPILAPSLSILSAFLAAYLVLVIEGIWINISSNSEYDAFLAIFEIIFAFFAAVSSTRVARQAFAKSDQCQVLWAFSFGIALILFRDAEFVVLFLVVSTVIEGARAVFGYISGKDRSSSQGGKGVSQFRTLHLCVDVLQVAVLFLFFFTSVAAQHNVSRLTPTEDVARMIRAANVTYARHLENLNPEMAAALRWHDSGSEMSTGMLAVLWVVFGVVAFSTFFRRTASVR